MGLIHLAKMDFENGLSRMFSPKGRLIIVIGLRWGDCGKGKIVQALCALLGIRAVVRYQGGGNAGHTIYIVWDGERQELVMHLVPSGSVVPGIMSGLGRGMAVEPSALVGELFTLRKYGFLQDPCLPLVDEDANVIMPYHFELDDLGGKIGTTKKGIGPCYTDFVARRGVRMRDLINIGDLQNRIESAVDYHQPALEHFKGLRYGQGDINKMVDDYAKFGEILRGNIVDLGKILKTELNSGQDVLVEGAQGSEIGIYGRDYPFCTSSDVSVSGVPSGLGVPPKYLGPAIGIFKAYDTKVGEGPMLCELKDSIGEYLRNKGHEFGATTKRPRRCGWLDAVALKRAAEANGIDYLIMTKMDVLSGLSEFSAGIGYKKGGKEIEDLPKSISDRFDVEPIFKTFPGWKKNITGVKSLNDLPKNARSYVDWLEKFVGIPLLGTSTGPDANEIIWTAKL